MLAINGSIITAATHSPLVLTPTINPGFYSVNFNAKDQYYYAYNISPYILPDKIYGEEFEDNPRILKTANARKQENKATSILLRGVKGSGKTLTLKQLALEHVSNGGIVLQVSQAFYDEGFISFLEAFKHNHTMLVIDEFEKVYNEKEEMQGLLSLLDGTGTLPLFTILTCNKVTQDMEYFINRPGRIYFKKDFTGLKSNTIEDYCNQELHYKELLPLVKEYSLQFKFFTIDMLSVLVEELNLNAETFKGNSLHSLFNSVVNILNIKPDRKPTFELIDITYKGRDISNIFKVENLNYLISHNYFQLMKNKDIQDDTLDFIPHSTTVYLSDCNLEVLDSQVLRITTEDYEIKILKIPFTKFSEDISNFLHKQVEYYYDDED